VTEIPKRFQQKFAWIISEELVESGSNSTVASGVPRIFPSESSFLRAVAVASTQTAWADSDSMEVNQVFKAIHAIPENWFKPGSKVEVAVNREVNECHCLCAEHAWGSRIDCQGPQAMIYEGYLHDWRVTVQVQLECEHDS
jgi:hypothetical protein